MATQVKQTCFLSAPYGQNIESVLRVLGDSGVDVMRLDNLVPGAEIAESVRLAVQEADFFCAILPEGSSNANVLFELGIAAGLEKALFLIVEPGVDLPLDLRGLPYVRASLSDRNSLASRIPPSLRTFLNGDREEERPPRVACEVDLDAARSRISEILSLEAGQRAGPFEAFVRDLLTEAGYVVSGVSSSKGTGTDLAVWIDDVESVLGNPVLVELKMAAEDQTPSEGDLRQLRAYMASGAARCGLLVTTAPRPTSMPETAPGWPLVFYFGAEELAVFVAAGSLPDELIARRNRAVHAKA
ncbi:MAG TPA: restriction endonuclease [Pirellulales bacterium]|jgi:hypothetical protein|nr:restriction endonuclease [Pirellulales bacterium]